MRSRRTLILGIASVVAWGVFFSAVQAAHAAKKPDYFLALEREVELLQTTLQAAYQEISDLHKEQAAFAKAAEQRKQELAAFQQRIAAAEQSLQTKTLELKKAQDNLAAQMEKPRQTYPLRFDGQVRIRPIYQDNITDLSSSKDDRDTFYEQRLMLGMLWQPLTWLQLHAQIINDTRFGAVSTSENLADLFFGVQQANLRIDFPDLGFGVGWVQAGRQNYTFGSGRLIGSDLFAARTHSFDGFLGHYNYKKHFDADVFVLTLAERLTPTGADRVVAGGSVQWNFMESLSPKSGQGSVAFQFAVLDDGSRDAEQKIMNFGIRLFGEVYGVFLDYESIWQMGQVEAIDTNAPAGAAGEVFTRALDHFAAAHFVKFGYNIAKEWIGFRLGLGGFFSWGSGDENWSDGKNAEFQMLYPNLHPYWGQMDLFGWSNVMDLGCWVHTEPIPGLAFDFQYHNLKMVESAGRVPGFSEHVATLASPGNYNRQNALGHEIDLALGYRFNSNFALEAGYSAFLPGPAAEAIRGLTTGDTAHWFYLQAQADL